MRWTSKHARILGLLGAVTSTWSAPAAAQQQPTPERHAGARGTSPGLPAELVRIAFSDSAFGVTPGTVGAAALARGAYTSSTDSQLGGGLRIWGSPLDRLTLIGDAERRDNGRFSPSGGAHVRVLGSRADHAALSLLGRYQAEGFAELEGEVELGLLGSFSRNRLQLDANAVVGIGLEEDERDGELLLRGAYELSDTFTAGGECRARYKLAGHAELAGARDWDAFAGPQILAHGGHFFVALTAGPSNIGISRSLGWIAVATGGGVAF